MNTKRIEFNFNDNVEVTLTKSGAQTLNDYNQMSIDWIKEQSGHLMKFKTDYKEGDVFIQQMWALFQMFGPGTDVCSEVPFAECKMVLI